MANFILLDDSTTPQDLVDGQFGFIADGATLATTVTAINATGSVAVTVQGGLFSPPVALFHDGVDLDLHVGQLGAIASAFNDTIVARVTSRAYVANHGSLQSGADALDLRESGGGATINILNAGTISGRSDGIVTRSGSGSTRIVNDGVISGAEGGIDHLTGVATLINRGEISGGEYAYSGGDEADTVRNSGSMSGGVFGAAGNDAVFNAGLIDFVELGDGDDRYIGRLGSVEDGVLGGAGNDRMRGGADADEFRGDEGDDDLRGRDGNDVLNGGAGKDLLIGGNGDDSLRGGANADIFRFGAGQGFDSIVDFSGSDKIDLTSLGLRSFSRDLKDAIHAAKGGAVIDLVDDFGLHILLEGVDVAEVRANDFLL